MSSDLEWARNADVQGRDPWLSPSETSATTRQQARRSRKDGLSRHSSVVCLKVSVNGCVLRCLLIIRVHVAVIKMILKDFGKEEYKSLFSSGKVKVIKNEEEGRLMERQRYLIQQERPLEGRGRGALRNRLNFIPRAGS